MSQATICYDKSALPVWLLNRVLSGEIIQTYGLWATERGCQIDQTQVPVGEDVALVQETVLCCIVIKTTQVLQRCSITELILLLCLHHGWSLSTQHFDSLEDIDYSLVTHPF